MSEHFGRRFLDFESQNNLFEEVTIDGIYYWDIIRFDIYVNLMWDYGNRPIIRESIYQKVRRIMRGVIDYVKLSFDTDTYQDFAYIYSRNLVGQKLIDFASFDALNDLQSLGHKQLFFESNLTPSHEFGRKKTYRSSLVSIYRKIYKQKRKEHDFSSVISLVTSEFGSCPFTQASLNGLIDVYRADKEFYKRIFVKHNVQNVFLTQNGIQKALISAAKECKIKVYEFQHGIVDEGHIAYNYPTQSTLDYPNILLPEYILKLGKEWFQNLVLPSVSFKFTGNNFFVPSTKLERDDKLVEHILVISADVFGLDLKNFLLEILNSNFKKDKYVFYFKLHPNQFQEKTEYQNFFKSFDNVITITNEQSISELMSHCGTLLTVQSTAVYEALQYGSKVMLYGISTYYRHGDVLDDRNVYVVNCPADFYINVGKKPITKSYSFFESYHSENLISMFP